MGKKELKRDLKLCESDLNSMADEAIFYRARALKAEITVERLICLIVDLNAAETLNQCKLSSERLSACINEWRANPPKDYREAK